MGRYCCKDWNMSRGSRRRPCPFRAIPAQMRGRKPVFSTPEAKRHRQAGPAVIACKYLDFQIYSPGDRVRTVAAEPAGCDKSERCAGGQVARSGLRNPRGNAPAGVRASAAPSGAIFLVWSWLIASSDSPAAMLVMVEIAATLQPEEPRENHFRHRRHAHRVGPEACGSPGSRPGSRRRGRNTRRRRPRASAMPSARGRRGERARASRGRRPRSSARSARRSARRSAGSARRS